MNYTDSTKRGDVAYISTGDLFLDLFALVGSSRHHQKVVKPLFNKVMRKDLLTALAIMLYTRDIHKGLGERSTFRAMLNLLGDYKPDIIPTLFPIFLDAGRYDDLFSLMGTQAQKYLISFIKRTLKEDLKNLKRGEGKISLLAKWMPFINCHSKKRKALAEQLASLLVMTPKEYRTTLSALRKELIIENKLRVMDYSFDYEKVPSQALNKYHDAFLRNDGVRYYEYLDKVSKGDAQINTSTLYPYQIVSLYEPSLNKATRIQMEESWKSMKEGLPAMKNTIVVRDGSLPEQLDPAFTYYDDYATSLAILFSENLEGDLKDTFITFSSHPEIVSLKRCTTLYDKLKKIKRLSTDPKKADVLKVYELIAQFEKHVSKENQIKRIIFISDMNFDRGTENVPTYETFKTIFLSEGLELPQVIYLDIASLKIQFANTKDNQVLLLSGASKTVFSLLAKETGNLTPVSFMNEVLAPFKNRLYFRLKGLLN